MPRSEGQRGVWRAIGRIALPIAIALCAIVVLAAVGGVGWRGWSSARHWLAGAMLSKQFLLAAGVTVGACVALSALCTALWRMGARWRGQRDGQGGTAMIEFVLVFPMALLMVLLLVQGMLLMAGNLCVHYAAFCAARSAVVEVPYTTAAEPHNVVAGMEGSEKYTRIRGAAVYAVMPVSCGDASMPDQHLVLQDGLDKFFQASNSQTPYWVGAQLGRKWLYAEEYTKVDLLPPANGDKYAKNEDITVTVQHTFYLSIPYARRIFSLGNDGVRMNLGSAGGDYGTIITATCRLTNEGVQDYVDIEKFPEPPGYYGTAD